MTNDRRPRVHWVFFSSTTAVSLSVEADGRKYEESDSVWRLFTGTKLLKTLPSSTLWKRVEASKHFQIDPKIY